eukprot:8343088-Ditylum_brightwellii.AAC.1
MLYEEYLKDNISDTDEGVDNPSSFEPDVLVGNLEEEMDAFDEYIGAELILNPGAKCGARRETVVNRARGEDGCPVGVASRIRFWILTDVRLR